MSRAKKLAGLAMASALAFGGIVEQAQARPNYCKEFIGHYAELKAAAEAKCGICHPVMDKKERNNYGAALGKAIGAKNEKDVEKIKAAMLKVEGEKSAVEGKTFGDLIKDGKLPGSK